ncbi:glycosyl hydrolase family 61-domain-containing protein [Neurospora tetraspora]|uniref:lytic cellulose monooxygenase (C4-dehydrogenating) n=1 Tax=Neurospora tetraspora TaxID=94610 RepID=A0AAE0JJT0_9PEZI|nr:glycosyl hydrolase family 61-domain-containing protein [Neurospora tetraspora]
MKVLAPLVLASAASAHTIFSSLKVNGVNQGLGEGVRVPTYNGPIEDVTSVSIACNGSPNTVGSTSKVITVQAGTNVTVIWRYMLSTTGDSPADVMDSTHKGPTIAYLKKVDNAATDSGVGNGWFKVQQDGMDSSGVWGTERVINGKGRQSIKIPECIAPGQYLLRAEMHSAGNYPGAQFYMECAQLNVVGETGAKTSSTVSFPGAYSGSDPGVKIYIYLPPVTSYTVPGPDVCSLAKCLTAYEWESGSILVRRRRALFASSCVHNLGGITWSSKRDSSHSALYPYSCT